MPSGFRLRLPTQFVQSTSSCCQLMCFTNRTITQHVQHTSFEFQVLCNCSLWCELIRSTTESLHNVCNMQVRHSARVDNWPSTQGEQRSCRSQLDTVIEASVRRSFCVSVNTWYLSKYIFEKCSFLCLVIFLTRGVHQLVSSDQDSFIAPGVLYSTRNWILWYLRVSTPIQLHLYICSAVF